MTCLDDDTVLGLVEGRLGVPALAAIDDHLDACVTCRDVVAHVARTRSPARDLARGATLGRYVIGELVGSGAMGKVYSAWEPELDRRVALKVLHDDGGRERMVREAQAMAKLDHPNVVGVHEVSATDAGVFVAMELVDGETLRAWAASPRPWRDRVRVLLEVAHGLAAVHAAGVVHRDIKPDNIIVGRDGRARLGDFGLARQGATTAPAAPGAPALALGTPTHVAGTPAYMAPELLRGGAADAASDQFSFGVTAYELLAGKRPFSGATWTDLIARIEAGPPPALRGVPGWLDRAIRRCLAIAPTDRFSSLDAVATHLVHRSTPRRNAIWIAAACSLAITASAATWYATRPTGAATCDDGRAEIAATWTAARRTQLAPELATAIDRWTAAWATERDAACRAAAKAPPAQTAARDRCLAGRRADLAALLDRAAQASSDRLIDTLAEEPPAQCRSAAADPLPLDPDRAASVHAVLDRLPALRAQVGLGDARPIVDELAALAKRADKAGHAATLADVLLVLADAHRGADQLDLAAAAARDALAAAERGHDDLDAARAAVARVGFAVDRRELAAVDDLAPLAAAAIDRAGSPPRLAALLLRMRGLAAYNRGDLATAHGDLTAALAAFERASGPRSLDAAATRSALGSVARAAGDYASAELDHQAALELDRDLRGPDHPDVARDLHNLAGVARLRGDLATAVAHYTEALALEVETRGPHSIEAALTHNSLGLVAIARKDWPAARRELTAARDDLTAAHHGDRGFAEHNLGIVAAATGDPNAALAYFAVASAIYTATVGDTAAPAIRLLVDQAGAELAVGQRPAARRDAELALSRARTADIAWLVDAARAVLDAGAPPTIAVEPAPPTRPRQLAPAKAQVTPVPGPPQPKGDVGVYGASQPWN